MKSTLTRRDFLKSMGIGTAGVAAALALASCSNGGDTSNGDSTTGKGGQSTSTNESRNEETQARLEEQGTEGSMVSTDIYAAESYIMPNLVACGYDPGTIPPYSPNMNGRNVLWELYQGLFDVPRFGANMVPVIADETKGGNNPEGIMGYDHEAGSKEYTVYIKDYVYDVEGNHLTANDVKFSEDYYYSQNSSKVWDKIEVIDEYTVKYTFLRELNQLMEVSGSLCNFLYTQKAFEAASDPFTNSACGTGSYKLISFTAGAGIEMERVDSWEKPELIKKNCAANVDHLRIDYITETAQQVIALEGRTVDFVESLATDYIDPFQEDANDYYKVYTYRDNLSQMITFNCHPDSPFSDENLRLAIGWAINYDSVVEGMGKGYAQRLVGPGNANFPDYNPEWETLDNYNTHKGSADKSVVQGYLDAAGYGGEKLRLMCESGEESKKIAQIIQAMLQQYGIAVDIMALDNTASQTVLVDPTQWDFRLFQAASKGKLGSILAGNTFNKLEATESYGGRSTTYIDDDFLAELGEEILDVNTYSVEKVDEIYRYLMEHAYVCGLMSFYKNMIIPQNTTSLALNSKNWPIHTACTFSDPNA